MVEPVSLTIPALAKTKASGDALLPTAAQASGVADSIRKAGKVTETQTATAAEKAQVNYSKQKLKLRTPPSKRNKKNFPQPKQSIQEDDPWQSSGAELIASDQESVSRHSTDAWSTATSAQRLGQIDTDHVGRNLNLAA